MADEEQEVTATKDEAAEAAEAANKEKDEEEAGAENSGAEEQEAASNEDDDEEKIDLHADILRRLEEKKTKVLLGLTYFNSMILVAVAFVLYMAQGKVAEKAAKTRQLILEYTMEDIKESKEEEVKEERETRFFNTGPITTNLLNTQFKELVRIALNLRLDDTVDDEELGSRFPQIRDIVIDNVNQTTTAAMRTIKGRRNLRDNIQNDLNTVVKSGKITGVYFSAVTIE